jgi:hypothetical protein
MRGRKISNTLWGCGVGISCYVQVIPYALNDLPAPPLTTKGKIMVLHIEDNTFAKTPVGAINTTAAITAQVLIECGLTQSEAANVVNEILKRTTDVITGKAEAVILEGNK